MPPPVARHPQNRLHFGKSVTDPKCSKCARGGTLIFLNRKYLIFLRKNIFGALKLFSEYFMMILIRVFNRLREGNRGNARGRLKKSNFPKFRILHPEMVLELILGGFWKSPKLKRKFPAAGFSTQELIFYF